MVEKSLIISTPVRDGPPWVPDCTKSICIKCNQEVWISPSSTKKVEEGFEVMCVPCYVKGGDTELVSEIITTKEQLDEIHEVTGIKMTEEQALSVGKALTLLAVMNKG